MIALIQRVSKASVEIDGHVVGSIGRGICALVGVEATDETANARRLVQRLAGYRIFPDTAGRMNRSLADIGASLLVVPQFTLVADTSKGTRPGFSRGADPALGRARFDEFMVAARKMIDDVACGQFGADMQVALVNDGPVTFWLTA